LLRVEVSPHQAAAHGSIGWGVVKAPQLARVQATSGLMSTLLVRRDQALGGLMGKQLYLQLREFWALVDCTLSEDEWEAIIRERCVDGRNPFLGG
jgi:hypothetical protein